jgi:hypothetical protein
MKSNSNKAKESEVEIFSLIYIFAYEPCPKLAYIKYEAKMP